MVVDSTLNLDHEANHHDIRTTSNDLRMNVVILIPIQGL